MRVVLFILGGLCMPAMAADAIYKCIKDDKVVFSQTACPTEYQQRKIQFDLGLTQEIDTDAKRSGGLLGQLMSGNNLSQNKMLQLIDGEVYRLGQENLYLDILKEGELQDLDRKRYWRGEPETDPRYVKEVAEMVKYFDNLKEHNQKTIQLLKARRVQIAAPEPGAAG